MTRARAVRAAWAGCLAVFLSCQLAPAALAGGYPEWVLAIRDCANDGKLDRTYSAAALKKAISEIPAFEDEYYGCTDTLRRALEGGSGKHEPPPPGGIVTESGAVAAAPEDVVALQTVQAAADAGAPVPVAATLNAADASAPTPLLLGEPTQEATAYPLWVTRDALVATLAAVLAALCLHALRRRRAS